MSPNDPVAKQARRQRFRSQLRSSRIVAISSWALALCGLVILVSWWAHTPFPTALFPQARPTSPILAACSLFGGLALLCGAKAQKSTFQHITGVSSSAIILLASILLIVGARATPEGTMNVRIGDYLAGGGHASAPSAMTIVSVLCLGMSLLSLFVSKKAIPVRDASCVTLCVIAWLSLIGFVVNRQVQLDVFGSSALSAPGALLMLAFGTLILSARPREGLIAIFSSRNLGGTVARLSLPFAFLIPMLIAYLQVAGLDNGLFSAEGGLALSLGIITLFLATQGAYLATRIEQLDLERSMLIANLTQSHSELRKANVHLSDLAKLDPLTGLLNRRGFDAALAALTTDSKSTGQPLSLLMMDLDGFKAFNDRYGHSLGDELLRVVAEILRDHSGPNDCAVRFGGDEFALLLPVCNQIEATNIADRIRLQVQGKGFAEVVVTISSGIATLDENLRGSLVEAADSRLYEAKRAGRNTVAA